MNKPTSEYPAVPMPRTVAGLASRVQEMESRLPDDFKARTDVAPKLARVMHTVGTVLIAAGLQASGPDTQPLSAHEVSRGTLAADIRTLGAGVGEFDFPAPGAFRPLSAFNPSSPASYEQITIDRMSSQVVDSQFMQRHVAVDDRPAVSHVYALLRLVRDDGRPVSEIAYSMAQEALEAGRPNHSLALAAIGSLAETPATANVLRETLHDSNTLVDATRVVERAAILNSRQQVDLESQIRNDPSRVKEFYSVHDIFLPEMAATKAEPATIAARYEARAAEAYADVGTSQADQFSESVENSPDRFDMGAGKARVNQRFDI